MARSGGGFTESERIALAWSKLHTVEKNNSNFGFKSHEGGRREGRETSRRSSKSPPVSMKRRKDSSRERFYEEIDRDRDRDRDRERYREPNERGKPSYSPYRGNPDVRQSPTYSPYRGNRSNSPILRRPRSRSPKQREKLRKHRSRSRSSSRSSIDSHELAQMPPPPDPVRPEHDNRHMKYFEKRKYRKSSRDRKSSPDRRRYSPVRKIRSRSRSPSPARSPVKSKWSHDRFTYARPESPERSVYIPKDYRPPSPKWISRAGGVAIMKSR